LTATGILQPQMVQALERVQDAGFALLLVTGRTLGDLARACPQAPRLFRRVVAENGAILLEPGTEAVRRARPVARELETVLEARGALVASGDVLIATEARARELVSEEVARLGLDVRLSLNRGSLMVLPAEVSKVTGLSHALGSLGLSLAEAVAVGDAENDADMLRAVGLGVAVGDAVPEAQRAADVVLDAPDGEGVMAFLAGLGR